MHKEVVLLILAAGLWLTAVPAEAAGAWETDAQSYKIRLENPKVRVLDVHYKPGHKVPAHTLGNRILIVQESARLKTRESDTLEKQFDVRQGEISWMKSENLEIENIGNTDFKAIIIEIK